MNYYLNIFGNETTLSTGNTLNHEYSIFERAIDPETSELGEKEIKDQKTEMRKELFGSISIEKTPFEFSEYSLIKASGYSLKEWNDLSSEEQGKIMALETLKNRMETLERFVSAVERNRKKTKKTGAK